MTRTLTNKKLTLFALPFFLLTLSMAVPFVATNAAADTVTSGNTLTQVSTGLVFRDPLTASNDTISSYWTLAGDAVGEGIPYTYNENSSGLYIGVQTPSAAVSPTWGGFYAESPNSNVMLFHTILTLPYATIPTGSFNTGLYVQTYDGLINYVACAASVDATGYDWSVTLAQGNKNTATSIETLYDQVGGPLTQSCTIVTNGSNMVQVYLANKLVFSSTTMTLNMPEPFNSYIEVEASSANANLFGKYTDYYATLNDNLVVQNVPAGYTVELMGPASNVLATTTATSTGSVTLSNLGIYDMPIAASLEVFDASQNLVATTGSSSFWGGDVYALSLSNNTTTTTSTTPTTTTTTTAPTTVTVTQTATSTVTAPATTQTVTSTVTAPGQNTTQTTTVTATVTSSGPTTTQTTTVTGTSTTTSTITSTVTTSGPVTTVTKTGPTTTQTTTQTTTKTATAPTVTTTVTSTATATSTPTVTVTATSTKTASGPTTTVTQTGTGTTTTVTQTQTVSPSTVTTTATQTVTGPVTTHTVTQTGTVTATVTTPGPTTTQTNTVTSTAPGQTTTQTTTATQTITQTVTITTGTQTTTTKTTPTITTTTTTTSTPTTTTKSGPASVIVQSVNQNGQAITGYWTVLYNSAGKQTTTGYTPITFSALTTGKAYSIELDSYGSCTFNHWQDNGNTNAMRSFTAASGAQTFTGVFNCTNATGATASPMMASGSVLSALLASFITGSSIVVGRSQMKKKTADS